MTTDPAQARMDDLALDRAEARAPYEPARHYGFHRHRADCTACGKPHTDVVFTFNRGRVTCEACTEELRLQEGKESA